MNKYTGNGLKKIMSNRGLTMSIVSWNDIVDTTVYKINRDYERIKILVKNTNNSKGKKGSNIYGRYAITL